MAKKSKKALKELAFLMDYEWTDDFPGYRVVPVLLPFSPFGKNVFFYSILAVARKQVFRQKNLLAVAIHEISHMMLYEILDKYHLKKENYQGSMEKYFFYLKEILAPVLMEQPSLKSTLDLSGFLKGHLENDDLFELYVIENGAKQKVHIIKYFKNIFEKLRYKDKKTFIEILKEMINIIKPLEDELLRKRDLWDKYQFKIFKDKKLLKSYSEPIKIQRVL